MSEETLTQTQITFIKRLKGISTVEDVASWFGVSESTISEIYNGAISEIYNGLNPATNWS
jgi:hypothetical protein